MSMFPHTVTVYNTSAGESPETGFQSNAVNYITILRGVLLDASKAVNVRTSGLEGADAVNLYIPFGVEAVDGVTGGPRRYVSPTEFWSAEDKTGLWTLSINGGNTFFVKGEVVEPNKDMEYINSKHDGVYAVTKVDEKDFGSPNMKHWEVGGA